MATNFEIEKREDFDINFIVPYAENAKVHSEAQIEHLAACISTFGFLQPLVLDKNHNLIAGHGRLLAAKKLGLSGVPAWILHGEFTADEIDALRIADNKINMETGFDSEKLKTAIDRICAGASEIVQKLDLKCDYSKMFAGTEEKLKSSTENSVHRMVLSFEAAAYDSVAQRMEKVRELNPELQNNTQIFLALLEFYEENKK